jgi:hypothetical protein
METSLWIALLLAAVTWPAAGWLLYRRLDLRTVVIALAGATVVFTLTMLVIRGAYETFFSRMGTIVVNGRVPPPAEFSESALELLLLWVNVLAFMVMTWSAYALVIDLWHAVFGDRWRETADGRRTADLP